MIVRRQEAEPYVGLRPYELRDAGRFYGRARETWELTSLVLSSRLVVVYGRSGVGKTSLLQAGVLAGLADDMAQVLPAGRPDRAETLPTATGPDYNPLTFELLSSWAPERPAEALRQLTASQFLQDLTPRPDRYGDALLPLVAVVDQFETLFRRDIEWEPYREQLIDDLATAMDKVSHLHLVLSMRQDTIGELLPHESKLSAGSRRRFRVAPLNRDAALDTVKGPLADTDRRYAPGVAEALVDRLRTTTIVNEVGERRTVVAPTVEPINLQVVCSALWRGLPYEVSTITMDHVDAYGDPEMTLTNFCVRAVIEVASEENVPELELWEWLERTYITDLGTRGAAYEGLVWTSGMPNAVAHALERRRILRSEERSGSLWFELLHDGLIEPIRRGHRLAAGLAAAGRSAAAPSDQLHLEEGLTGSDPGSPPSRTPRPDAFLRMAESALHVGDLVLAEQYARGAVRASEHDARTSAEANSFLGGIVLDEGRSATGERRRELYATAERHYRRAMELFEIEQNPGAVARVLGSLGRCLLEQGRFADALAALQSAVERLESDVAIRLEFAHALALTGQPAAAAGEYTAILTITPGTVDALLGRGVLTAEHGDPAAALRDLDEAVRHQPEVADRVDVIAARARANARLQARE